MVYSRGKEGHNRCNKVGVFSRREWHGTTHLPPKVLYLLSATHRNTPVRTIVIDQVSLKDNRHITNDTQLGRIVLT